MSLQFPTASCGASTLTLATVIKIFFHTGFFALAIGSWLAQPAYAQAPSSFVLTSVSGDGQIATIGQIFAVQFAVRLTDPSGNPLQGAQVNFQNLSCISFMGIPCEFPGAPGHFESGSDNATVITNAAGIAVAPSYYAGAEAGAIGLEVIVVPDVAPYFFTVSLALSNFVEFRLQQVPVQRIVPTPVLSVPMLRLLCVLLVLMACFALNRRGAR